LLHNGFAYHFTPAGAMVESGAHALGCAVFPGGVGQTEAQARAIATLRPAGYCGTPSFLKLIHEKGRELGLDLSSLGMALVSGEALPATLRAELAGFGTAVLQCYASADLGLIAYESAAREGMILDELVILEIVRPGTGDPLPEGEVGEVVVTSFNLDYPLIRFATGDLSAILPGTSPCGRTNQRIKGWLGRADQTTKVRGMFVHPAQIADIVKRHPEIAKARLVVDNAGGGDTMTLRCALASPHDDGLAAAIAQSVQSVCKLRGEVAIVAAADLPNDGKIIEDRRKLD
jgi:phenylacetate-CoA ligase